MISNRMMKLPALVFSTFCQSKFSSILFHSVLLPEFAGRYHEALQSLSQTQFGLVVKDSLEINKVCPLDVEAFVNDMFLSYLLPNGPFFSFSCYMTPNFIHYNAIQIIERFEKKQLSKKYRTMDHH